jgi:hypothetical protein
MSPEELAQVVRDDIEHLRQLPMHGYVMCEASFGAYRVILGYASLKEAQDAHAFFVERYRLRDQNKP